MYFYEYGSIDDRLFKATDVANWIEHSKVTMMLKPLDENEKVKVNNVYSDNRTGGNGTWFLTEDGLYEVCMQSRKPIAKQMKKQIKQYLKSIRLTGAAIPEGREQEMVNYYFSNLSPDLQGQIVNELMEKNKELQQFFDDLMNTDGLYSMNITAKELKIGRNTLFAYLRGKDIMFYKDNSNIPYQRFMNQGLFEVVESPCADGQYRPTTYATKKGLEYIRKLLRKDGYYTEVA
jgi:phage antirepressor YoqD-like protein